VRSFAAAKTSGPALHIGTRREQEFQRMQSTSQYKFIATYVYVGYSLQAQGVRKKTILLPLSSPPPIPPFLLLLLANRPLFPQHPYFIFLLLNHIFFSNKFFSFSSSPLLLTPSPLPAILIHLIFSLTLHSSSINAPFLVLLFALDFSFLFHVFFISSSPILPSLYSFFLISLQCSE
jgi:hypothetical protein